MIGTILAILITILYAYIKASGIELISITKIDIEIFMFMVMFLCGVLSTFELFRIKEIFKSKPQFKVYPWEK